MLILKNVMKNVPVRKIIDYCLMPYKAVKNI